MHHSNSLSLSWLNMGTCANPFSFCVDQETYRVSAFPSLTMVVEYLCHKDSKDQIRSGISMEKWEKVREKSYT